MKLVKILMSSMFVFTAVIKSATVGWIESSGGSYTGICAEFNVLNQDNRVVSQGRQCATTWPEIQDGIKLKLQDMQEKVDQNILEIRELRRMTKVSKEIVGAVIVQ